MNVGRSSTSHDDIVNLEDHTNAFCCKGDGAGGNESWLNNLGTLHIHDSALTDVETSMSLSVCVPVSKLCDEKDRVKTGVLSERVGNKLKRLSVCSADVGVVTVDGSRVDLELMGDFHLDAGATVNKGSLLDESSDDTEGVMEGAVSLVEDQLVGASKEDGDGFAGVRAASHFDNFSGAASADLLDEFGRAELLSLELVNVSNGGGTDGLGDEIDLFSVDILDNHNLLLGEEMESEIADGLSQDTLLEEKNIGAGGNDLFDDSEDVLTLLLDDSVHGDIVTNGDAGLHVGLGGGDRELNESNLGVFNSSGTASKVGCLLVDEAETVNELRLIDGSSKFPRDVNVSEVNVVGGGFVNNLEDGIDSHRGKKVRMVRHNL